MSGKYIHVVEGWRRSDRRRRELKVEVALEELQAAKTAAFGAWSVLQ